MYNDVGYIPGVPVYIFPADITAEHIRLTFQLAVYFSADFWRTEIRWLIRIWLGALFVSK